VAIKRQGQKATDGVRQHFLFSGSSFAKPASVENKAFTQSVSVVKSHIHAIARMVFSLYFWTREDESKIRVKIYDAVYFTSLVDR
jgi:hypothetical protein